MLYLLPIAIVAVAMLLSVLFVRFNPKIWIGKSYVAKKITIRKRLSYALGTSAGATLVWISSHAGTIWLEIAGQVTGFLLMLASFFAAMRSI